MIVSSRGLSCCVLTVFFVYVTVAVHSLTIIEFPSVHLVLEADAPKYPPYQPSPHPNNSKQQPPPPQHPTVAPAEGIEATADASMSAAPSPFSAAPFMHPDRAVRAAGQGLIDQVGGASGMGFVKRWQ